MIKQRSGAALFGVLLLAGFLVVLGTQGVQAQTADDINIDDQSITEDGGTQTLTVDMPAAAAGDVDFDWATEDGTATGGADFTAVSDGEGTIADGETETTIEVVALDDGDIEGDETFEVVIYEDGTTDELTRATVTIEDDEDQSNIAIAKSSDVESDATVDPGDPVTYTIAVTNDEDSTVAAPEDDVVITDDLPEGVTFDEVNAESPYTCTEDAGEVTCTNTEGEHPVDTTADITIDVTVDEGTEGTDIENTASAAVASQAADPDDSSATVTVGEEGESNVAIAKSSDATDDMVEPGDEFTYTITVTNEEDNGTVDAPQDAVTVTDALPEGVSYDDHSAPAPYSCVEDAGELTCTNDGGAHPVNAEAPITIDVTVDEDAADGEITNTASATVDSQTAGPDDAEATVTVADEASGVTIAKSVVNGEVELGGEVEFTIDVTNDAESDDATANSVEVMDTLPDDVVPTSAEGDDDELYSCDITGQDVSCTNDGGDHVAGDTHTITIMATVDAEAALGDMTNEATLEVDGAAGDPSSVDFTVIEVVEDETHTYELSFRWTLIGWVNEDMSVADALNGEGANEGGDDIADDVSAVFGWDAETQTWGAYFPGAGDFPGANDLETLERGQGYWVAIDEEDGISWDVVHSDDDDDNDDDEEDEAE